MSLCWTETFSICLNIYHFNVFCGDGNSQVMVRSSAPTPGLNWFEECQKTRILSKSCNCKYLNINWNQWFKENKTHWFCVKEAPKQYLEASRVTPHYSEKLFHSYIEYDQCSTWPWRYPCKAWPLTSILILGPIKPFSCVCTLLCSKLSINMFERNRMLWINQKMK